MKVARIAAFALGLAAVLSLPAAAAAPSTQPEQGITVSGIGTVRVAPDVAALSFGVQSEAQTASAALRANAAEMRRVIAALKAAGVAAADLRTQQVWLAPRSTGDGSTIAGYTAASAVDVTLRDLRNAGGAIDAAVEAGANQVYGPSLRPSDTDALTRQALAAAYDNALAKAKALASRAGVALGRPISIVEGGAAPFPLPVAEAGRAIAPQEPTPIEPGTTEIQAAVTVTFAFS